jgi:hypothetical protein
MNQTLTPLTPLTPSGAPIKVIVALTPFKVLRTVHSFKDHVSTEVSLLTVDAKHGPSTVARKLNNITATIKKLCAHLAHQRQYNLNFK